MILDDIVAKTKERVAAEKQVISLAEMKALAKAQPITDDFPFYKALSKKGLSYILEVKKASPSKGLIAPHFDYVAIAQNYEAIGADAISVLTEPDFFQGDIHYLKEITQNVSIPVLRKDFIIDEYMIYQAKANGASAILLITGILDDQTLKRYLDVAHHLGLSALVEARDETQVKRALASGARIIGVNNRDLRDFTVDIHNSLRYMELIPDDVVFVSESGIEKRAQTLACEEKGASAVLIGETFMKAPDQRAMLAALKGESHEN